MHFYLTVNVYGCTSNLRKTKWNGVKNVFFSYQPIYMLFIQTVSYLTMVIWTNRKCWKLQRKRHRCIPPPLLNIGFFSKRTKDSSSFDFVLPNMPALYTSFYTKSIKILTIIFVNIPLYHKNKFSSPCPVKCSCVMYFDAFDFAPNLRVVLCKIFGCLHCS